jgi:hypothetical protein
LLAKLAFLLAEVGKLGQGFLELGSEIISLLLDQTSPRFCIPRGSLEFIDQVANLLSRIGIACEGVHREIRNW